MKIKSMLLACVFSVTGSVAFMHAASAADATATVSATCNDATSYSGTSKKGACSGHKGVKEWSAPAAAAPAAEAKPAAPAAPAAAAPAAGGGAGKVWVNTKTKVYHCEGNAFYGKTKEGSYMTEAEAKAAGNRADHGKACSM